jgi:hypothetical protein
MSPQTSTTATDLEQRRQQIIDELAALGPALPGSLVQRRSRCGNAGCHCRTEPSRLHGPYWAWTRSVGGKTITRSLSDEQADRYRPWFDNAQRLRELLDELKELGVQQAQIQEHPLPN